MRCDWLSSYTVTQFTLCSTLCGILNKAPRHTKPIHFRSFEDVFTHVLYIFIYIYIYNDVYIVRFNHFLFRSFKNLYLVFVNYI